MSTWEQAVEEADKAFAKRDCKAVCEIIEKAESDGTCHVQLMWRRARALHTLGDESLDKSEKERYAREAAVAAERAVEEDPTSAEANLWKAICIGILCDYLTTKERMSNVYVIRDHLLRSLELKSDNPDALHGMGMWSLSLLQISWFERSAASLLFGSLPTVSHEECLKYFLASHELRPSIRNCLALGNLFRYQGNWTEAKTWYQKALDIPAETHAHKQKQDEAVQLLNSC